MVAVVDVGTAGIPVDGTDPVSGNIAQIIQFTAGTTTAEQFGAIGAVDVGRDGIPIGTVISVSSVGNAATISGMTDAVADVIDGFTITYSPAFGGTTPAGTRTLTAADFASVSTYAQLLAVVNAIDGSGPSDGVTATTDSNGALQITSPFLSKIDGLQFFSSTGLSAEQSTVDITGVSDAEAADVAAFAIAIDGVALDTSGLDFSTVTNRAELAAVLDALPGVAVTQSADNGGTITITAEAPGPRSLTGIVLGEPPPPDWERSISRPSMRWWRAPRVSPSGSTGSTSMSRASISLRSGRPPISPPRSMQWRASRRSWSAPTSSSRPMFSAPEMPSVSFA
jgi:hypothetical protein